ncbi:hypothetical protein IU440_28785 [Nocardia cyriacigeorgica]|uniref:hypothetical protein n=1 Tax=Nocardia cyriacigeorgica TaxID=135487 RepID=UPI001894EC4C|nr:hypothetical protein [Nocardia cyriacigeorgica]MBF6428675.1 hypothetical protein [Nocardia cyriacigeorgica]
MAERVTDEQLDDWIEHASYPQPDEQRAMAHELIQLRQLVRDFTDPDEQEVTAVVYGHGFDNAGFWPMDDKYTRAEILEQHAVLIRSGVAVAAVNLATLFAWASEK